MRTLSLVLSLLVFQFTFAQDTKRIPNTDILDAQWITAQSVMQALENGAIETAAIYFDNSIDKIKSQLSPISAEIIKVKSETELSIVVIYNDAYNIYRCRYYNESGSLYQVDLFMQKDKPDAKVKNFETKKSIVLRAEQEERMKSNFTPTPPPPPGP